MPEEQSPHLFRPKSDQEILEQATRTELLVHDWLRIFKRKPAEDLMVQSRRRKVMSAATSKPTKKVAMTVSVVALLLTIAKPAYDWLRSRKG